jgi:transcriptional regulator with XRE-family HTH domain
MATGRHPVVMAEIKQRIASAVRAARKAKGLSQQKVAEDIGTTLETVSKCERGASAPSVEVFLAMVRVLGLNVNDLANVEDLADEAAPRATVSTKRHRLEAEVTATARSMPDAELQLYADFGKLLGKWKG